MVKIQARRSVERAVQYFLRDSELSLQERTGRWMGDGAVAIGLNDASEPGLAPNAGDSRIVTEPDFAAALRGYAPPGSCNDQAGRALNGRYVPGVRRCAWDVVFSPHKSISVAALCLPAADRESQIVRTAFNHAIEDAFLFLQSLARRANGCRPDIVTGSLLAAAFEHETSRRNDPQLHRHVVAMNATRDPSGSRREWYALEPLQLYRQARTVDMIFQRALGRH